MVDPAGLLEKVGAEADVGFQQGLGWDVFTGGERRYYQRTGGGPGFALLMRIYPDESLALTVMANGTVSPNAAVADLVAGLDW